MKCYIESLKFMDVVFVSLYKPARIITDTHDGFISEKNVFQNMSFAVENSTKWRIWALLPRRIETEWRIYASVQHIVKHVYNDHPMGYFSAFWSSSR